MLFEGSEAAFLLENVESRAFSLFSKKVEKSMPKGTSKVIVDAERHRRTPWTPADESKSIRGEKSADIGDTGGKKKPQNAKIMKISFKWQPKSMKNH